MTQAQSMQCGSLPDGTEHQQVSRFSQLRMRLREMGRHAQKKAQVAHEYAEERADEIVQPIRNFEQRAASAGGLYSGRGGMAMGKKGNFNMLSNVAKSLVVFGIMVGLGILLLTRFQDSADTGSKAENEIGNVVTLYSDLVTWGGIVLLVIIGYIVLRYLNLFGGE